MSSQRANTPSDDPTRDFVTELLRTGLMLSDLLANLLEDIPDDAFPGENPGEVLVDMLVGTSRPVVEAAGAPSVREAATLMGAVADRTLSDLRAALRAATR